MASEKVRRQDILEGVCWIMVAAMMTMAGLSIWSLSIRVNENTAWIEQQAVQDQNLEQQETKP